METEMKNLDVAPRSPAAAALAPADTDVLRYTSLRDIILSSPRTPFDATAWSGHDVHGLLLVDASAISIRNQLVKHAASAYLRSAAFLDSRNESCLARLWARLTGGGVWSVRRPLSSCVVWAVRRIMACLVGHVGGVWGRGGRTTAIA